MPVVRFTRIVPLGAALFISSLNASAGVLLELYQQALTNNPTLLSRQYAVDEAKAREDIAFSRLLPQVSANGSYSLNSFDSQGSRTQNYDGLRGTVQARQSLFDLASYFRYRGAEALSQQTENQQEAYRMELAGDLVDRYLQALEAVDSITYLNQEKEAVETQNKRLTAMHQRQMAKVTDVYQVEAYYQELQTRTIEAENKKAIALEALREITGSLPAKVDVLSIQSFPDAPNNADNWISDALRSNPSLAALKAAQESADQIIAASKSEHLPQLSLQLAETYADQGFDNRQQPPYTVASANLMVTVPIYEGGRVDASVREAVAKKQMVIQDYERVRRRIERETRNSFLNATSGFARIDSTLREVEAQQKTQTAQQRSYELGASTIVDVLDSRREALKALTAHHKAIYDYARSLIMLRVWSGGLSQENIEEVDRWFSGLPH